MQDYLRLEYAENSHLTWFMDPKSIWGLYNSRGIQHIAFFQQHITSPSITGQLLRAAVEWAQIHLGQSTNIFSIDYDRFEKLLPRSFIKTLWEYCWENKISIRRVSTFP